LLGLNLLRHARQHRSFVLGAARLVGYGIGLMVVDTLRGSRRAIAANDCLV